jgi:NADH-ubiquinone oxidoreductase chain 5
MNVTETFPENVSYLLVIYYQNIRSYGAGMLTLLSNRIRDGASLLVIA